MAKYPYIVIKDGKWYKAGEEVPSSASVLENRAIKGNEEVVAKVEQPIVEKQPQYTKTDINRLSTTELKALAKEQAIDGAEDMTGGDLKKVLIEKFGL